MAKGKNKIRDFVRQLADRGDEVYAIPGTVTKVAATTCNVQPLNGDGELFGIQLAASDAPDFLITPAKGSLVIVVMLSDSEGFIGSFSKIEKVDLTASKTINVKAKGKLKVESDATIEIKSGSGIKLNIGANGGVVKVLELAAKLNLIETDLNAAKTLFAPFAAKGNDPNQAGTQVLNGDFSGFTTWSGKPLKPTVKSELENVNVTH